MHPKSAVILRILANRYLSGSPETSLAQLPQEEVKEVSSLEIDANDPSLVFLDSEEQLNRIHYSWFLPLLKRQYKDGQQLMLKALPHYHASKLGALLKIKPQEENISPIAKSYLLIVLLKNLTGARKVLPREFLPKTPLRSLVYWTKNELVELIDCLGLHDVANELKLVLDQKKLKLIYGCLPPKEQQYLRACMHAKEKIAAPLLGIDKWNGDKEKLKLALQTRGLARLGKAISGETQDFVWHLSHILDNGRGGALIKSFSQQITSDITQTLVQQVQNIMTLLKKVE